MRGSPMAVVGAGPRVYHVRAHNPTRGPTPGPSLDGCRVLRRTPASRTSRDRNDHDQDSIRSELRRRRNHGPHARGGTRRREAVVEALNSVGGSLEFFYYAFGETDVLGVFDIPDQSSAAALSAHDQLDGGGEAAAEAAHDPGGSRRSGREDAVLPRPREVTRVDARERAPAPTCEGPHRAGGHRAGGSAPAAAAATTSAALRHADESAAGTGTARAARDAAAGSPAAAGSAG